MSSVCASLGRFDHSSVREALPRFTCPALLSARADRLWTLCSSNPPGLPAERRDDLLEDNLQLARQQSQHRDYRYADEKQDQPVFDKGLSFLVTFDQLIRLAKHLRITFPLFLSSTFPTRSGFLSSLLDPGPDHLHPG